MPKKRKTVQWNLLPPALRQHCFELWIEAGYTYTAIAAATNLTVVSVRTIAKRDFWRQRYEERVALQREQYDANANKLIEQAKPQITTRNLKTIRKHDAFLDDALDLAHKQMKSSHEVDPKVLTAVSKAMTNSVSSGLKLIKPENDALPRGTTFQKGSVCIVGLQPIRKLEDGAKAALEAAKTIEAEEIVQCF